MARKTQIVCNTEEEYDKFHAMMQKHSIISENYVLVIRSDKMATAIEKAVKDKIDHVISLIPDSIKSKDHLNGILEREGIK